MSKKKKKNPLNWRNDTVDTRSTCAKCEIKLPNNTSVKLYQSCSFIHEHNLKKPAPKNLNL